MNLGGEEFVIRQFGKKKKDTWQVSCQQGGFVRVEHKESGITVTKYSPRGYIRAMDAAGKEILVLVRVWKEGV